LAFADALEELYAGSQGVHRRVTADADHRINQWRIVSYGQVHDRCFDNRSFRFCRPAAFGQAAIQEPGAFEFYHPDEDVLDGGAPTPEAALASTARTRNARAAIDGRGWRADFNKSSAPHRVGADSRVQAPRVGAFATQPWTYASPCEPAGNLRQ